jgi:hypothetical protein
MNEFETNNQMEQLARLSEKQPDAISSEQRMSLGLWQSSQELATTGLTAGELLRLRGLKLSVARDVLSPQERITKSVEILNLEKKNTGEIK